MFIVRPTKKSRDKIGGVPVEPEGDSTTVLGDWYANLLAWRRPNAILMNARTLVRVIRTAGSGERAHRATCPT